MSAPSPLSPPIGHSFSAGSERSESPIASSSSPESLGLSCNHSSLTSPPDILDVTRASSRLRAMRSGVLTSTRLIEEQLGEEACPYRRALYTLTYARPGEWAQEHVSQFIACCREWLRRRGFPMFYVWVMEIQEQRYQDTGDAVPHYHVLVWLPPGVEFPLPDDRGWWPHGMTKSEWVRSPIGVMDYLTKYLSKGSLLHLFPPGARMWGAGGLSPASLAKRKFLRLPQYLREVVALPGEVLRCVRVKAGGWFIPGKGMWVRRSPYRVGRLSWTHVLLQWVGWQPGDIQYAEEVEYRGQTYRFDPWGALC